jgi:hypothetical protein
VSDAAVASDTLKNIVHVNRPLVDRRKPRVATGPSDTPLCSTNAGTDVMILKIFSPKKLAKQMAFLTQNKAKF